MDELNFSQQVDESFKNITSFFEELATLLKDCDRLMGELGYTSFTGNNTLYGISYTLLNPKGWVPSYFGRTYVSEENLKDHSFNHINFISIFLRYGSGGTHDVEIKDNIPLIVAGMIIPSDPEEFKFEGWVSKSWFWKDNSEYAKHQSVEYHQWINDDAKADGSVVILYPKKHKWWENLKQLQTFAYPLEEIENTGMLKAKIIDKLIEINEDI